METAKYTKDDVMKAYDAVLRIQEVEKVYRKTKAKYLLIKIGRIANRLTAEQIELAVAMGTYDFESGVKEADL